VPNAHTSREYIQPTAAALLVLAATGCYPNAHWYEPVTAQHARGRSAELESRSIGRNGSDTTVRVRIRPNTDELATGRPRLSTPDAPPCADGVAPETWSFALTDKPEAEEIKRHGTIAAQFSNDRTDGSGLLVSRPTVLDVPMTTLENGTPEKECLRLPILASALGDAEWRQQPHWWTGIELRTEVPVHRVSGIDGIFLVPVSVGAFAGPLRVGLDVGLGFGVGPGAAGTQSSGAGVFEIGARVDSPLVVIRRFAMGVKLAYALEAWNFGTDTTTRETVGVAVHGPRAALRFLLLPPPPPSTKYDARPDAWSTGIELGTSLLFVAGDATPTAAIGGSYFGDIGW
jgi:hypothetical protein